jgi:hypothetical protein
MTMKHWSLWVAMVVVSAPGAPATTQEGDLRVDLAKAQATWQARKPASYEFTIEVRCFCLGIMRPPPTFRVVAGEPSPVATLGKDSQDLYGSYNTVEKLFAAIERSLTRGQYKSTVHYDDTFGFPVRADLDPQRYVHDEELYLRVSDFGVIEK